MRDLNSDDLRSRCHFGVSLRFEIFFALHSLLNPDARIHLNWRQKTLAQMPTPFFDSLALLGGSAEIWPSIEGALPHSQPFFDIDQLLTWLENLRMKQFQRDLLLGDIHVEEIVEQLVDGTMSLSTAMGKVPKVKRDWLSFLGLYPYDATSPLVVAVELLLKDPEHFRKTIINMIQMFWEHSFKYTWSSMQNQFQHSLEEKERMMNSCSFGEFAQHALLRVRVDENEKSIEAIRGGYKLFFDEIESCHFFPSAFNDRRYWSGYKTGDKTSIVYFPYFDPAVRVDNQAEPPRVAEVLEPELDPALIFRALGDSTRYAMVSLLARRPMTSVEISKVLAVSKATISHHIAQMREAGLISEKYEAGAVKVSLKREVFEKLSSLTLRKLFDDVGDSAVVISRTRKNAIRSPLVKD
jgi:DNA-binding transcriptional ArsR family regulator